MKKIKLTQNKHALVDDEDYEYLNQWKWQVVNMKDTFYAHRKIWLKREKRYKTICMHRIIMNAPNGRVVDHINHNSLDNQRENLRICTQSQNLGNSRLRSDNKSGIKGVYWSKNRNKWVAQIRINSKSKYLGIFTDINVAKNVYEKEAKQHFGEFYNEG